MGELGIPVVPSGWSVSFNSVWCTEVDELALLSCPSRAHIVEVAGPVAQPTTHTYTTNIMPMCMCKSPSSSSS